MPEIKNVFRAGIMNKDDDERIIPNGQYRDALNIEVSTSEDSDVGTVQNILGNVRVEDLSSLNGSNMKAVGAIADEKNDVLYWFVTGKDSSDSNVDAIIEYSSDGVVKPILVDRNNNVLKFDKSSTITGINIIDNLLFWTDNINEPKKINIDTFKLNNHTDLQTHSKIFVNDNSFDVTEDHITVIRKKPYMAPKAVAGDTIIQTQHVFSTTNYIHNVVTNTPGDLPIPETTELTLTIENTLNIFNPFEFGIGDIVLASRPNQPGNLPVNYEVKLKVKSITTDNYPSSGVGAFTAVYDVLEFSTDIDVDEAENLSLNVVRLVEDKPIFEKEFVRFATRYKYADGEYSAFSPFTQPVFIAGTFGFHPIKDSHNVGMTNKLLSIKLQDLVPDHIPDDVVQLDILFKKDDSTTIYTIDSIKPGEANGYWDDTSYAEYTVLDTTYTSGDDTNTSHVQETLGYKGQYEVTTENIYAALPANQILRPWDNVPRKALAQEITGNRLVYGNYLQNYNLRDFEGKDVYVDLNVGYNERTFGYDNIDLTTGKPSVKSDRTYYLGIIYGDKYGRETPVFTGKKSSIKIPFDADVTSNFDGNASRSLQLVANLDGRQPSWAYYYKYFVKQTTEGYHNLTLDRVYKSVTDQSMWLSFPSSDRNKLQEGDYVIMKKQIETDNQVPVDNKIKIIDIKNEAPESIKFNFTTLGTGGGSEDNLADLFPDSNGKPAEDAARIAIDKEVWVNTEFGSNLDKFTSSDRFAIQFSKKSGNNRTFSGMYFVASAYQEDDGQIGRYVFILRRKITAADQWVESSPGVLDDSLTMELFLLENKDTIEFEGRFFAKIASSPLTQKFLLPSQNDVDDYALVARAYAFWLHNTPQEDSRAQNPGAGIFNVTSGALNGWSNSNTGTHETDTEDRWAKATKFNTDAESSSGWFIDNAFFISAQEPFDFHNQWDAFYSGRMTKGNPLLDSAWEVNGLEGIVEVNNNTSSDGGEQYSFDSFGNPSGARNWSKYSVRGNSTLNTYNSPSNQEYLDTYKATGPYEETNSKKGIFMHLSFACPGVDLHNGYFPDDYAPDPDNDNGDGANDHFIENLQWILSGGIHFQGDPDSSHGKNYYDFNQNVTAVGLEAHDNQFNPGYLDPGAGAVANQLAVGNQFKFEGDDINVYTIQSVDVKFLYNHTSWNPMLVTDESDYNTYDDNLLESSDTSAYSSVSNALDKYCDSNGFTDDRLTKLKNTIVNFGKANNRRVCFIVQLDKDPRVLYDPRGTGKADDNTFNAINFIDTYIQPGKNTIPATPAIFETEAKEETDLNIYYEVTDALPRILDLTDGTGSTGLSSLLLNAASNVIQDAQVNSNSTKGSMLAPLGSRVDINLPNAKIDYSYQEDAYLEYDFDVKVSGWDGNIVSITNPGFVTGGGSGLDWQSYADKILTFYREDGTFTKASIWAVREESNGYITKLELRPLIHGRNTGIPYYNCISFGNGVESTRIRDDFNGMSIAKGVKASTTFEQGYEEERRKYGLIYSGIYNSTSGVNSLNEFIQAEKITKDVNPVYGSIQKLYARNKDLVTLCEDKILQIFVDRDILFNADGNSQLLASNRFLGATQPFRGNYGISKNPESFAAESFRAYYTDKQRGAVMRLSMDGLTPISSAGMHDFFRDNLKDGGRLYGSYDAYKQDYNLSIFYEDGENTVLNSNFEEGLTTDSQLGSNIVLNHSFSNTTTAFTDNLLSSANSSFSGGPSWNSYGTQGSNSAIYFLNNSALFFHDDSTQAPNGTAWIYLDISSLGINDGDTVKIDWEMYLGGDVVETGFNLPAATVNNAKPSTDPFKVTMHNDNSGAVITNGDISSVSGGSYDNTYSFTKTMDTGNVPTSGAPNTGANENTLRIISQSLQEMNHVFVDNVSVKKEITTVDDWTLSGGATYNNGVILMPDGSSISQTQGSNIIEAGKKYKITYDNLYISGSPKIMLTSGSDAISLPSTVSGTDHVFTNDSDTITLSMNDGSAEMIYLQIEEIIPIGGSVANWDLNGTSSTYLYTTATGTVVFDEAPENTYLHQTLVNTNRILDFDEGTKCNVAFDITNYTGTGELTFRLYNDQGEGFEYPITGNGSYSFLSTIGNNTSTAFTSKFGFYVSSADNFSGTVDNVSLSIEGEGAGKTITFNEKSKGWTSFKSFIPEVGISSVNQYYTTHLGQLWKHHVEQFDENEFLSDGTTPNPNYGKEINRNNFYGTPYDSSVTPVLNSMPEVVKHFNTLNYEGTQSKIDQFLTYDAFTDIGVAIGSNLIDTSNTGFGTGNGSIASRTINSSDSFSGTDFGSNGATSSTLFQIDKMSLTPSALDVNKTYRISFDFDVTGVGSPELHFIVVDGTASFELYSEELILTSNGSASLDFTPPNANTKIWFLHPFLVSPSAPLVSFNIDNLLLQELDFTVDQNDGEYYNLQAKPGWYVSNIHTDKQEGTLNEFIEKEGKWFNYIKGTENHVDPAAFNFQGLGIVNIVNQL